MAFTRFFASGIERNSKLVQERLGHASITLTLDTYSHVIPSLQEEVARKMDDLISLVYPEYPLRNKAHWK